MFDIGWSEILVVVIITILVVGPKELPGLLRTVGKTVANLRRMAGDFQNQFNDALREAELDDVANSISDIRSLNPRNAVKNAVTKHLGELGDVSDEVSKSMKESSDEINASLNKDVAADKPAEGSPAATESAVASEPVVAADASGTDKSASDSSPQAPLKSDASQKVD
ncbi:Sec-independent protein translocase protein TatB [Cohaesibacter haloalkalitolerans]|uniref:Sec-independent protein translocase protein TatB n=1 Tax=Cohaesibacter haloalkalitolerans TaxID=1162980 RepID=UPI000E649ED5|nr:Sec-independent protein translocase protein TatB [Cohaesibacter haloalkalitolerans]